MIYSKHISKKIVPLNSVYIYVYACACVCVRVSKKNIYIYNYLFIYLHMFMYVYLYSRDNPAEGKEIANQEDNLKARPATWTQSKC